MIGIHILGRTLNLTSWSRSRAGRPTYIQRYEPRPPGIPGNRGPKNSLREFPGISEILAGITGNFASFVFFPNF